jgi:hypothetical protein
MAISRPKAPRASRARRSEDAEANLPPIDELTPEEAWDLYVESARTLLGVTPEEFERRWARGEYDDPPDHSNAVGVWLIRTRRPAAS